MRFFNAVDVKIRGACVWCACECLIVMFVVDAIFRVRWQLCERLFAMFVTWGDGT